MGQAVYSSPRVLPWPKWLDGEAGAYRRAQIRGANPTETRAATTLAVTRLQGFSPKANPRPPAINPKSAPAASTNVNGHVFRLRPPDAALVPTPNSLTTYQMSTHTIIEVGTQIVS